MSRLLENYRLNSHYSILYDFMSSGGMKSPFILYFFHNITKINLSNKWKNNFTIWTIFFKLYCKEI